MLWPVKRACCQDSWLQGTWSRVANVWLSGRGFLCTCPANEHKLLTALQQWKTFTGKDAPPCRTRKRAFGSTGQMHGHQNAMKAEQHVGSMDPEL